MNWMTKVAILIGRKKFEEFAQANPQLPDDALAVANTLDTYPVRGAVTLIAGSLAHAADNVLRGTETVEQLTTHLLLVLAGLCIIWVRHAISKHDVKVNAVVQKARQVSGLSVVAAGADRGPDTAVASVTKTLMILFVPFVFFVVNSPSACAQTNAASGDAAYSTNTLSAVTNAASLFTELVSDVGSVTKFSSGVGVNLHGKVAPLLSQELSLFGHSTTNSSWSTGPSHATFFLPAANEEQLGWTTAAGPPAGISTNAITYLRDAQRGLDYNNVNGIIFTNVPYFTQNQSTNTVGFSNVVFDTVQLFQGGTNFVLHGATLSFTNASTQGGTFSLSGNGTLAFGESISYLLPGSGLPTSLSYSHTSADNGSGTGTLTLNASGGDLDIQLTTNNQAQAVYLSLDSKTSFKFKHDTGASVYTKEFIVGLNTDVSAVYGVTASLGEPGFTWDFSPPHMCYMINLGIPWALGGYSTEAEAANIIIDQFNDQSSDGHKWYPGNNTNFPALWVKAGGYQAISATGAVMNSDWINIGAIASTNNSSLPRAAFIGVASNEDFLAIWPSIGMSTNGSIVGSQYSTNATDAAQFGTNRFAGFLFGHNDTFGVIFHKTISLLLRDETNGLQVLSVSTNNGGSVYLGPTNNLQQALISGGATSNISISGSTFYYTNGLLQGVTTP